MTKQSPNVIFKSKYCLSLNSVDNKFQDKNYKKDRLKDVDDMMDYFSNDKKRLVGMFEYYMGHTRGENVNLVLEDGEYATKKEVKNLKDDYKNYIENSNLWKGIISFKKDYLDDKISIRCLEEKMAKEIMPHFLKYCGFKDTKNMSYVFSIHTNKKHTHIHLAFIEKKPNYLYCNKKINYRRKGKITVDEQNYLKRLVELSIEKEKYFTPLITKTNKDIDFLKSYFDPKEKNFALNNVTEIFIEEKILKLGELLKEYRNINNQTSYKIKYNSIKNDKLGSEIKKITNEIKHYLFSDKTSILYDCKKDISNDIEQLNNYFNKLNQDNNIIDLIKNNSIITKKENYINNYIYNSIVNHSLYKYNKINNTVKSKNKKDKITVEDLIQEIAYQNNLKNKKINDKQRRKNILQNYFKFPTFNKKFSNKYKMEKAMKNINFEMEKAKEEFSKLFTYEN